MAADVEEGVEVAGAGQDVGEFVGVRPEGFLFGEELAGCGIGFEHFDGGGVEGSFAAFGGGDCQFDFVVEDFPGVGEFRLRVLLVVVLL